MEVPGRDGADLHANVQTKLNQEHGIAPSDYTAHDGAAEDAVDKIHRLRRYVLPRGWAVLV